MAANNALPSRAPRPHRENLSPNKVQTVYRLEMQYALVSVGRRVGGRRGAGPGAPSAGGVLVSASMKFPRNRIKSCFSHLMTFQLSSKNYIMIEEVKNIPGNPSVSVGKKFRTMKLGATSSLATTRFATLPHPQTGETQAGANRFGTPDLRGVTDDKGMMSTT
ncbi:hypothetical protein EVAR_14978_1 [Eumeta japonica]|uniref:Uncharacterized protein n=1 Tax=Eumeta variegata TaxID=151549 RepID=A0A4C1X5F4_EUMVA|nr:hypothetical protein EVAR_14978_1 [Eumeta japonica]